MSATPLRGVGTALLTPFRSDGSVDHDALAGFVEFQIKNGVHFLVPCGTTGESATLSEQEQLDVISTVMKTNNGRLPVVAGLGGNNTAEMISRGQKFRDIGVTQVLTVSPYYNKPNQEGIYQHYKAFQKETGLEIVLYNIQGRTGSNVEPTTLARLAREGIIFAIKEASGSYTQIQKICQLTEGQLTVLSGDDAITPGVIVAGGQGVICTTSNVLPGPVSAWVETMLEGDFAKSRELLKPLLPVFDTLFIEPNPQPVKGAAAMLGLMEANFRLPMIPPSEGTMNAVREVMKPFMN